VWDAQSGAAVTLNLPSRSEVLAVDATDASLRAVVRDEHGATGIVDAQSGATIQLPQSATAASFSADGSLLVTSSDDGAVKIWKSNTGGLVRTFEHDRAVQDAALTRDNQRLVSFTDDGAAHIWTIADTRPHDTSIRLAHDDPIDQVDVSPDGRFVVTVASRDARLFDVSTPRSPKHLWSWSGVNSAEFSPTRSLLLMADDFGQTRLYDAEHTRDVAVVNLGGPVLRAAFAPDGNRFATASTDRITRVWTIDGDAASPPLHHEDTVSDVAFNRDGSQLVTVTADGLVRVWDLAIGPPPIRDPSVDRVVFAPRGTALLTLTRSEARIWNSTAGPPVILSPHSQLYDAAFSPDARRVITASEDHRARMWDAASGAELLSLEHDVRVQSASFRPDGAWLATAGASGGTAVVTLWELATGRALFTLPHPDRRPTRVEFSGDGSRLLTLGSNDLTLWDLGTRREIPGLRFDDVTAASFSSDSRSLLVRRSGTVRVYDIARGEGEAEFRHENYLLDDALFGSSAKVLVIVGGGYARVWDARSGAAVTPPLGHGSRANVRHAVMSGDGRLVVTAADDGSVRLWDAQTGQPLSPPLICGTDTPAIAIAPDATRIATAGNNVVRVWGLSPEANQTDAEQATVARALAAREIDTTGAIAPLDQNAMLQVWSSLKHRADTHR
jgi:WD40 repeat protein